MVDTYWLRRMIILRSIMTNDLKRCYYCGTTEDVNLHHVIHGNKEKKALSMQYHLLIGVCGYHHRGDNGIHGKYGKEMDLKLKAEAQRIWEDRRIRKGKSTPENARQEWIDIFGEDYILQFNNYINECKADFISEEEEKQILDEIHEESIWEQQTLKQRRDKSQN